MRVLGKLGCGLGAAAAIYVCVSVLLSNSRHGGPKNEGAPTQEESLSQVERIAPFQRALPQPIAEQPSTAAPSAPVGVRERPAAEHPEPDRTAELAATLEAQYAVDARRTRDSA